MEPIVPPTQIRLKYTKLGFKLSLIFWGILIAISVLRLLWEYIWSIFHPVINAGNSYVGSGQGGYWILALLYIAAFIIFITLVGGIIDLVRFLGKK